MINKYKKTEMEEGLEEEDFRWKYGVCDSPEQLASKYPKYDGIVWMTVVRREEQCEQGGWRWRKWGEYVGNHTIDQVEYLSECNGDDGRPLIDEQYLFDFDNPSGNVLGLEPYRAYRMVGGKITATNTYVTDHPFMAAMRQLIKH